MDSEFLLEKKLADQDTKLSQLYRNMVFTMNQVLQKTKAVFPSFTDHSMRHVMIVTQFCGTLIGQENIDLLNVDEVFILLCAALFHDFGMCIDSDSYDKYTAGIVPEDYFIKAPEKTRRDAVREYHQEISGYLITKYKDLFEIPSDEHTYCIAQVARGHRRADLMDPSNYDSNYRLPNGNRVCLSYLSAILRLADELDIAQDRNSGASYEEHGEIIDLRKHFAIKHMNINDDSFELVVIARSNDVFDACREAIKKLDDTLKYCKKVIESTSDFTFKWVAVKDTYVRPLARRAIVLNIYADTDDAIACSLIKNMGEYIPDYIIASVDDDDLEQLNHNFQRMKQRNNLKSELILKDDLSRLEDLKHQLEDYNDILIISIGDIDIVDDLIETQAISSKFTHLYLNDEGLANDPEIAKKILASGIPITLFSKDLADHQRFYAEDIDRLENEGVNNHMITLLRSNLESNQKCRGIPAAIITDVMPILFLSLSHKFVTQKTIVICDDEGNFKESSTGTPVYVAVKADENMLYNVILETSKEAE